MLKKMTMYFHSNKSDNYNQFSEFCENDKAKENCCYIGYEIEIEGNFNTETAEFSATSFNGVELIKPVII